ncbi:MAG: hypothetical protein GY915_06780 [bacterium]|nr:hypothetical protein [bacterium]
MPYKGYKSFTLSSKQLRAIAAPVLPDHKKYVGKDQEISGVTVLVQTSFSKDTQLLDTLDEQGRKRHLILESALEDLRGNRFVGHIAKKSTSLFRMLYSLRPVPLVYLPALFGTLSGEAELYKRRVFSIGSFRYLASLSSLDLRDFIFDQDMVAHYIPCRGRTEETFRVFGGKEFMYFDGNKKPEKHKNGDISPFIDTIAAKVLLAGLPDNIAHLPELPRRQVQALEPLEKISQHWWMLASAVAKVAYTLESVQEEFERALNSRRLSAQETRHVEFILDELGRLTKPKN